MLFRKGLCGQDTEIHAHIMACSCRLQSHTGGGGLTALAQGLLPLYYFHDTALHLMHTPVHTCRELMSRHDHKEASLSSCFGDELEHLEIMLLVQLRRKH